VSSGHGLSLSQLFPPSRGMYPPSHVVHEQSVNKASPDSDVPSLANTSQCVTCQTPPVSFQRSDRTRSTSTRLTAGASRG
jgi:hypothetical protein